MAEDPQVEPQALPAAIQILAPVSYNGIPYAAGRVIAPPDQATYTEWRQSGKAGETSLAADAQVLNQGTAVGSFTAPWSDSSGRLYPRGLPATITAGDAAVAKREGKVDSATLSAPALTAVSATGGVASFTVNWTSDQYASAQIQFGPTTGYGTTVTAPVARGPQTYVVGPASAGTVHYRVVLTSVWGTTTGTDLTVVVT